MLRRGFLSLALAIKSQSRLATFEADITPPLGTPLCLGLVVPATTIAGKLQARGLVLQPARQKPIVLCSLDWISVGNTSQDAWKQALALAAGTEPSRVVVHTVHQHDAPGSDAAASSLLNADNILQSDGFATTAISSVAAAVRAAKPRNWTHVSGGEASVEQVASNRRILGSDGKVEFVRLTACRNSPQCGAPEGVIDPKLKSIGFWDGSERLASVYYYATHPMSYYGKGSVSADFPGLARAAQDSFSVYFTGAGGNIGAGKYNDGSPDNRQVLANRLADAMARARSGEQKHKLDDVAWASVPVRLPHREGKEFTEGAILADLQNTQTPAKFRANAARYLAWYRLSKAGRQIPINCLNLGPVRVLHMPGELFVEYQLAAQKELPNGLVAMAAYGDYGPMYIGTAKAYDEGGYETSAVSRVGPDAEQILLEAQRKALRAAAL
jgi:hypothetical protein